MVPALKNDHRVYLFFSSHSLPVVFSVIVCGFGVNVAAFSRKEVGDWGDHILGIDKVSFAINRVCLCAKLQ